MSQQGKGGLAPHGRPSTDSGSRSEKSPDRTRGPSFDSKRFISEDEQIEGGDVYTRSESKQDRKDKKEERKKAKEIEEAKLHVEKEERRLDKKDKKLAAEEAARAEKLEKLRKAAGAQPETFSKVHKIDKEEDKILKLQREKERLQRERDQLSEWMRKKFADRSEYPISAAPVVGPDGEENLNSGKELLEDPLSPQGSPRKDPATPAVPPKEVDAKELVESLPAETLEVSASSSDSPSLASREPPGAGLSTSGKHIPLLISSVSTKFHAATPQAAAAKEDTPSRLFSFHRGHKRSTSHGSGADTVDVASLASLSSTDLKQHDAVSGTPSAIKIALTPASPDISGASDAPASPRSEEKSSGGIMSGIRSVIPFVGTSRKNRDRDREREKEKEREKEREREKETEKAKEKESKMVDFLEVRREVAEDETKPGSEEERVKPGKKEEETEFVKFVSEDAKSKYSGIAIKIKIEDEDKKHYEMFKFLETTWGGHKRYLVPHGMGKFKYINGESIYVGAWKVRHSGASSRFACLTDLAERSP